MKRYALLPLIFTYHAMADTTVVEVPDNRFDSDTIYAEWDSLTGFAANGSGSSTADATHQISTAILNQATGISTPGGLLGSPTDRRVYTFEQAADWTITATSNITYNTLTLRVIERLSSAFGDPNAPVVGHTNYNVTLNNLAPTAASVEAITQVFDLGSTTFEIDHALTTFTWNLPSDTTQINLQLIGAANLHDSVDAFVIDAETLTSATDSAPDLSINIENGQVILTWPDTFPGTIESSTDLGNTNAWQDVIITPTQAGGVFTLTLPLPNPATATFYRLRY